MKKGIKILVAILIVFILGILVYFFINERNSESNFNSNSGSNEGKKMLNPAEGLTLEEAVAKFDENFVYYLLYNIGASDLHSPPFSSAVPQIKFYINDDIYNAEIIDGQIKVNEGEIEGEDIIIRTTTEEAVKMVVDQNYVANSFSNGLSSIELVAGKLELASKGYLKIYDRLNS
ncbi:MAG: hypothetical protein AABX83_03225 [Nanoarchaeota archaeon]